VSLNEPGRGWTSPRRGGGGGTRRRAVRGCAGRWAALERARQLAQELSWCARCCGSERDEPFPRSREALSSRPCHHVGQRCPCRGCHADPVLPDLPPLGVSLAPSRRPGPSLVAGPLPTLTSPRPRARSLGTALVEALDELINSGHINPQLALMTLNQARPLSIPPPRLIASLGADCCPSLAVRQVGEPGPPEGRQGQGQRQGPDAHLQPRHGCAPPLPLLLLLPASPG